MGRGPAGLIKFLEAGPRPSPARQCVPAHRISNISRPGPTHGIRSEAHEAQALHGPARCLCESARGFEEAAHGLLHVLTRSQKCTTLTF